MINLFEYQNKVAFPEQHFDNLEMFLDAIWSKREKSSYYNEDENREEVQHFLQFLHKNKELKSNKFVGVIHFEDQTINLLPKIFYTGTETTPETVKIINSHVLWWLSYCRKLRFPNYLSGLNSQQADFFEILIYLFSKYTRELLNSSVYQRYIEVENELTFVKGRLNFQEYINQNLARGRNHKVNCIYDSFEMDNPFNQCIKSVCRLLLTASKDIENKRNLNDILFLLDEVSDATISAKECKRILFNPMFADFETVRDYCVLFLENSVSFNYKNDLKLFAFLLPMEYVFEDFLFGFIDKELEEVNAKNQIKNKSLDEAKTFGLKPDLLLTIGDRSIIADTKYKMVYADSTDAKKEISQNDLYQMIAYAIRFKVTDIKLFYPNTINNDTVNHLKTIEIIDELANNEKITIKAHQVSVIDASISIEMLYSLKLSECFENLRNKLSEELNDILI
ncbi:McrC family protein [Flavobacterium sp. RSB2_4_14]|uniref:McrC family protein n=1 Tax=Flavobacterium sp. RSB2_4_14 TaxID=3447665 RepID=UPI003F3E3214